jgi:hypothetical protein
MQLSSHLALEEFTHSDTAERLHIDNTLPNELIPNAVYTATHLFEAVRAVLGVPIRISSGYRCEALNVAVRGVKTSQHVKAQALDMEPVGMTIDDAFEKLKKAPLMYDQLIKEHCGDTYWIHMSIKQKDNRQQIIDDLEKKLG